MKKGTKNRIYKVFEKNNGYARATEVSGEGIHRKYLNELVEEGFIVKLKRGLYKWEDAEFSADDEMVDVAHIVPKGVICLLSAISFHDLSTYTPSEYQMAIPHDSKVVLPNYPPIKLFYFTNEFYDLGIEEVSLNNHQLKVYDLEKTICDCFRFENEVGKDILIEAIQAYMREPKRNITKLMQYAERTDVKEKILPYVEVLL